MPLKSQLHVNQLLSNVSVKYNSPATTWQEIFPMVQVAKDNDLYRVYDRNWKLPETGRAPKALAREMSFEVSTSSYILEQHAIKDYVGVDEAQNYDMGSLQVDATENLTDIIYRRIEKSVADLFTKTSWSLNVSLAATAVFTQNTTVSDPVPIFDTAQSTIIANSGLVPNFGILPRDAFIACKNHISVLDRIKYTSSSLSEEMMAGLFGLPKLLIPTSSYDSDPQGIATTTGLTNFYSDFAFVGYKPASAGVKVPSSGYIFSSKQPRVRTWFDDERNATAIEVEVKYKAKVVASLTGYLINNVV